MSTEQTVTEQQETRVGLGSALGTEAGSSTERDARPTRSTGGSSYCCPPRTVLVDCINGPRPFAELSAWFTEPKPVVETPGEKGKPLFQSFLKKRRVGGGHALDVEDLVADDITQRVAVLSANFSHQHMVSR